MLSAGAAGVKRETGDGSPGVDGFSHQILVSSYTIGWSRFCSTWARGSEAVVTGEQKIRRGREPKVRSIGGHTRQLPLAALLLLALIWGYAWVVMKNALEYVEPFTFAALRTAVGTVALFVVLLVMKRPLKPKALGPTAILGLLQTAGFVGLLTWALEDGGAGKTSILIYTMPFWLLLMAWVVLGEKLKGFQWVAVVLALAGLILILSPWRLQGKTSDFLAVGGAVVRAASAVYAKILRRRHEVDLLSLTAWQMVLGVAPLVIGAILTWEGPPLWTGTFIWSLLYVGILGNAVAWLLWLYILHKLRAGTAGLATLLTPVIGIGSAWIQLGERPSLLEGLGMVAIVGALLLTAVVEVSRGGRSPSRVPGSDRARRPNNP
jgi:drug/metabolite transporter (DMT)-like permease